MGTLPFYAVPGEIMATTKEQLQFCTVGSGAYVPDWISQSGQQIASDKMLSNKLGQMNIKVKFVDPEEA